MIILEGVRGALLEVWITVLSFQLLLGTNHEKSQSYRDLGQGETERQRQETDLGHNVPRIRPYRVKEVPNMFPAINYISHAYASKLKCGQNNHFYQI